VNVDGLPAVPSSALPASVRSGSAADQRAYKAALGFESVLLGELVQQMLPEDGMPEGPHGSAVQDALTSGLVAAGGTGLAASLYPTLRRDA